MKRAFLFFVIFMVSLTARGAGASERAEGFRLTLPQPEYGCPFPDYTLPDTRGNLVRFSDFRGRVLLLSFCSCYTDTCCAVIDALEDLRSLYAPQGLETVVVCCEIADILKKDGYAGILGQCAEATDVVLLDEKGKAKGRYEIKRLPTTFLLDVGFCTRFKATTVGSLYTKPFRQLLEEVLQESVGKE